MIVPARHRYVRPLRFSPARGFGDALHPTTAAEAAAFIAGGQGVGSPLYQMNLAAAQNQPDFNQAQFDAWWQCTTKGATATGGGFQECPAPTFVAYAGTAPENRPAVLPQNVIPSATPMPTTQAQKAKKAPPPPAGQAANQPSAQSNAPAPAVVTTPGAPGPTAVQSNAPGATAVMPATWLTGGVSAIPSWVWIAGAVGIGALFLMGGRK